MRTFLFFVVGFLAAPLSLQAEPFAITEKAPTLEWKAFEDDHGGFYLVWTETREGVSLLRAQHLGADGQPAWSVPGAELGAVVKGTNQWAAFPDARGGVGLVWLESGRILAQLWDPAGQPRWAAPILISSPTLSVETPVGVADAAGGLFVVWAQQNYQERKVLLAQHVSADGRILWNPEGLRVSLRPSDQRQPRMIYDGAAGFHVAWNDKRELASDLRVQRMNFQGFRMWGMEGSVLATPGKLTPLSQSVQIALEHQGPGAARLAWAATAQGRNQIVEQSLSAKGLSAPADPYAPQPEAEQWNPVVWGNGVGQTWVGWEDSRNLKSWQVYVRGPISERPIAPSIADQGRLALAEDAGGDLWAVWIENRAGRPGLFVQRLDPKGTPLFGKTGRSTDVTFTNPSTPVLIPILPGKAVAVWSDQPKKGEWTLSWTLLP